MRRSNYLVRRKNLVTKIKNDEEKYYFTERLKNQMGKIHKYPLTILEASSGFGKTTAVREYFNVNLTYVNYNYWYTCDLKTISEMAYKYEYEIGYKPSQSIIWKGVTDYLNE
ncbi:MAG: hypothetical protein WBJ13_05755 [Sedimentibacter sp.]